MMGLRKGLPDSGPYVLRGDRHLAIRMSYGDIDTKVLLNSTEDINSFLNKHHTGYVIVERNMISAEHFPEYKLLLETLNNKDLFMPVALFNIESNYVRGIGNQLAIYQFNHDKDIPIVDHLKITIPTIGKDLQIPMK